MARPAVLAILGSTGPTVATRAPGTGSLDPGSRGLYHRRSLSATLARLPMEFQMTRLPYAAWVLILSMLGPLGCATGGLDGAVPGEPTPMAAEPTDPLEPSPAALRTAERVELTGTELGTMWTFENPPLEYWRTRYGFEATPEWLEHVRLASVRYGEICSASFVSPTGLVMTNHHCARECIEAVSSSARDYLVEGFYAPRREDELLCPGLFLDQLVGIDDVTERVRAAAPADAPPTEITAAQEAEQDRIEQECTQSTGNQCQVVALYHGGQFRLYQYRRFAPVKLVFAPELDAGFFGGDLDNFTYPRYALDVAFVRAYEEGGTTPARTPQYFAWSPSGAKEGDLVFVTGNPGSTSRQITVTQALYEKAYRHPFTIDVLEGQRQFLLWVASMGPEAEREVRDQLFSIENSLKAYRGQLAGLQDTLLVGRKIRWEWELRQRVEADPRLRAEYGDLWDRIAEIQAEKLRIAPRLNINNVDFIGEPHVQVAGQLVRYIRAMARPEAERPEEFRGERLARVQQLLSGPLELNREVSVRLLTMRLDLARRWLDPDDPFIRRAFRSGESPEQAAARLVDQSRIGDVAFRTSLMQGGTTALEETDDPLVQLVREMIETYEELEPRYRELSAEEDVQEERLALALFAVYGTQFPPDATFTLRITDGVMEGYPYNGTVAPAKTTYYGLFGRAADFDNVPPYTLPASFARRREALDMTAPVNFVTTNDITGGNSGSPMIDREARVVGLAFDSNIEGLANEFLFRTEMGGRTVGVHSVGIMEALRSVYQADALVNEILGASRR